MRGRKHILALVMTLMFAFGILSILPATAQGTYVTVYVESTTGIVTPPAGPYPVYYFQIDIYIASVGLTAANGIKKWAMDVQFNTDVHDLTYGAAYGAQLGYAMYDWWDGHKRQVGSPLFVGGIVDPTTGFWNDIAEGFTNTATGPPSSGLNDLFLGTGYLLVTLEFDCLSAQPALIDLIDFEYVLVDDTIHSAEVVIDGFYGERGRYMSYQGSLLPPGDPTGTQWHELYPQYCNMWDLIGWTDNGDGDLTASDQISMVNATGWTYQFHVDKVTVTIHWTFKPPDPTVEASSEPFEPNTIRVGEDATTGELEIVEPIGTTWHELYPEYCREFVITSHEDTDGDGNLDISEQFDFEYFGEGIIHWAHLDDVTTDIILSQKGEPTPPVPEFPLGLGIVMMVAPLVPVVYLLRKRKKVA